jgi:hypothetical protein
VPVPFIAFCQAAVDLAFVRGTPGGDKLSPEMLLLLVLITCDDYELFPPARAKEELTYEEWLGLE